MARQPRFEYLGAIYHVMARGNGDDEIFVTDDDRKAFLFRLSQVCGSHSRKVHAWVIMGNHFHLLLETPQANLVTDALKKAPGTHSIVLKARLYNGITLQDFSFL
jgi:putative transposase